MKSTVAVIAILAAFGSLAPRPAKAQERPPMVPLKIDLVVTRQAGDKKVASLPYTMWVTANDPQGGRTSLRVGSQLPVSSTRVPEKDAPAPPAFTYRDIGTNIDCVAVSGPDGRFVLRLTLGDSSVHVDSKDARGGLPVFRNFSANFNPMLRDGQSATYTSAADPLTGEVIKIDATLTVLK